MLSAGARRRVSRARARGAIPGSALRETAGARRGSWLVLHLIPIVGLVAPVYLQMQLNKAWETRPESIVGSPAVAVA